LEDVGVGFAGAADEVLGAGVGVADGEFTPMGFVGFDTSFTKGRALVPINKARRATIKQRINLCDLAMLRGELF